MKFIIEVIVDILINFWEMLFDWFLDLIILMGLVFELSIDNFDLLLFELNWYRLFGFIDFDFSNMFVIIYNRSFWFYCELV